MDALILEAPYTSIRKATECHVLAKVQSASAPPPPSPELLSDGGKNGGGANGGGGGYLSGNISGYATLRRGPAPTPPKRGDATKLTGEC